ncbi:MAG: P1 family peptidase [Abditibacteriales bacterium]|nr:P1 family peptidase [Abditibacteriales bacterium]
MGSITDVDGIWVGHDTNQEAATGCTVIIAEGGAVGGVDVRGGAASTRGTDMLNPLNLVERVNAIVLTGGSAFGLDAACGVMEWLEARGVGFDVGVTKVPIVSAAVIFDLSIGSASVRPDRASGRRACEAATPRATAQGNVGVGTGATVGKLWGMPSAMKGGLGVASLTLPDGVVVGALVVVNAFGDVRDWRTGELLAGARDPQTGRLANTVEQMKQGVLRRSFAPPVNVWGMNTTLGVVATNAALTKTQATKIAQMAHDGLARSIAPVHTMFDGDAIFALSCGDQSCDLNLIGVVAAEVVAEAINNAVRHAETLHGVPAWREV